MTLGDGQHQMTGAFSKLQITTRSRRGPSGRQCNDKGKVENLLGYARRNFMFQIPSLASWEAPNE